MKKLSNFICILLTFLLLYGCADPKILERISLAVLIGYDIADENKITTTSALRTVNQELQSVVSIASKTDATSKGTRIRTSLDSSKKIVAGQLRVVLLGEKLAKAGVTEILHTLMMNSEISSSVYVAVAEGETKSMIDKKYEQISDIGQHIFYLLDHNVEEQFTLSSTLHEIMRDNYSPYNDMILPIIKQDEDDVQINGAAIFNSDMMVGKLEPEDIFYVVLIREKFKAGAMQLTISGEPFKTSSNKVPDQLPIAIDSINSKRKTILVNENSLEFDLNIKLEARILEVHSTINTEDDSIMTKLEKELTTKMESDINKLIKQTQVLNSDVLGFGEIYRATVGTTKTAEKEWKEKYPKIKVNVHIDFTLLRNGVFE